MQTPRRLLLTLATVSLTVAVLIAPHVTDSEPRAAAAPLENPNIVLILTDDQTMESVARMPYLNSASHNWVKFTRAYANNGLCCPARATILRGQYDTRTRVVNNATGRLLGESETLAVWLDRAGYDTGLYGKYLNVYPFARGLYVPPGWTDWHVPYHDGPQWGIYDQYTYKLNANGVSQTFTTGPAAYQVDVIAGRMVNFIRSRGGRPFFAMFTPTATHGPWTASPSRRGMFNGATVPRYPGFNVVAPDQPAYLKAQPMLDAAVMAQNRRKEWAAAVSVDDAIRRIDSALETAGVKQNTIVVFTTDNAFSYGRHRWERKRCEYNECNHTPIWVRYPGVGPRTDSTNLISNVDIARTIADFAGATPGVPQDGRSFAPLVLGEPVTWRSELLMHWSGGDMDGRAGRPDSMPQWWAVLARTSDGGLWKYVELDTGERELYDERADPNELNNRAGEAATAGVQAELRQRLAALKSGAGATTALRADVPVPGPLGPDEG